MIREEVFCHYPHDMNNKIEAVTISEQTMTIEENRNMSAVCSKPFDSREVRKVKIKKLNTRMINRTFIVIMVSGHCGMLTTKGSINGNKCSPNMVTQMLNSLCSLK